MKHILIVSRRMLCVEDVVEVDVAEVEVRISRRGLVREGGLYSHGER